MFEPTQRKPTIRSLISRAHIVDEEWGVLSLVRRFDKNEHHAFLVLETIENNGHALWEAHLVIRDGMDEDPKPKANILYREMSFDRLRELSENCHAIVWDVTQDQIQQFHELVQAEQVRADADEIDYQLPGNAPVVGFFGGSLEASQSQEIKEWSIQNSNNSSSQYLLRKGENCYSWAKSRVVQQLDLPVPTEWSAVFVQDPRNGINGVRDGKEDGCRIL